MKPIEPRIGRPSLSVHLSENRNTARLYCSWEPENLDYCQEGGRGEAKPNVTNGLPHTVPKTSTYSAVLEQFYPGVYS